jgi:predicted GNAT superfamily acetyltransferase
MATAIADLREFHMAELCALNNVHASETSFLSEVRLSELVEMSFYARGFPGPGAFLLSPDAFLLAMDESSPYDNANFQFFQRHHERFVYIDRMITARHARRQGLARRLYEDLFARARSAGHTIVGCEVNLDPPNPGSDAFHERLGFESAGQATLENGKTVRYLQRRLL